MIKELSISTSSRQELLDLTPKIRDLVNRSGIIEGVCIVYCPHTTAAITINESADPDVKDDILSHLKKLIPKDSVFKHFEGNSDSHIKSSLFGASETLIIKEKKLILGTWQNIYFAEFDGPRQRKIILKLIEG